MHAETLANPAVRAGLYKRLMRRNRVVGVLRVLVPVLGAAVLGMLVIQIVIANTVQDFGVSGIRIERDRLLIETPRYEGVTESGMRYKVVAETASALIAEADIIELGNAKLDLVRPDGSSLAATAKTALYNLVAQTVEVEDVAYVQDSRDTRGTLYNTFVDWAVQTIDARDGADITFADGTSLVAGGLKFFMKDNRWDMSDVTLVTEGSEDTL